MSKYLVTFFVAMMLIIVIVITFDVSEKLDDFLSGHAPLRSVVFDYYLNFIPGFVNLYSALFIFISVIFFTSKMAGNTEIIAILGSGISYRRMLRPFLHGAFIVAIVVFVMGNFVLPISNRRVAEFDHKYIHTRHDKFYNNIHFQLRPGVQVYADEYVTSSATANQFFQDTYNDDHQLTERLSARRIVYDSTTSQWRCYDLYRRTINGADEHLDYHISTTLPLEITPKDFLQRPQPIETMNTFDLYQHIEHEKMRGSTTVIEAQIELYQRLFTPLAVIIMTVMAVAVSSRKSRGGMGIHLAIGISLAFAFVVFMKVTTVFATNGNLPPVLAVLLPQIVFALAAAYLVRIAPK